MTSLSVQRNMGADSYDFYLLTDQGYAKPLEFQARTEGAMIEPFYRVGLHGKDAVSVLQELMNDLWQCGVRPTIDGTPESELVKAKDNHIAELSRIVERVLPAALRKP